VDIGAAPVRPIRRKDNVSQIPRSSTLKTTVLLRPGTGAPESA